VSVRVATALVLAALAGCASTPPASDDGVVRAQRTVDGFREASAWADELLGGAAAWAVFPGVEELGDTWTTEGFLFVPGAPPREVRLHASTSAPTAPARRCYHALVVIGDPSELARLESGALDLAEAHEVALDAGREDVPAGARACVVTTARIGLLFPPPTVKRVLELAPEDSPRD
jgi:hypothetical protein